MVLYLITYTLRVSSVSFFIQNAEILKKHSLSRKLLNIGEFSFPHSRHDPDILITGARIERLNYSFGHNFVTQRLTLMDVLLNFNVRTRAHT